MSDVTPPSGDWSGSAALVAALGAAVAAVFRRGASMHKVRNELNPVAIRVAVLEEQFREVTRRLDSIERKLDRALDTPR